MPSISVASTAPLSSADVSGCLAHPALLDACLSQAASHHPDAVFSPLTWVRSAGSVAIASSGPEAATGGHIAAALRQDDAWAVGNVGLVAPGGGSTVDLREVVIGEHDRPPSSPGPVSARVAEAVAEAGEEEDAGIAADNPLLQMSEEERMLHLQAQARYFLPHMHLHGLAEEKG